MTCSVTEMVINLVPGNRNDVHFAGKAAKTLRGGTGVTRCMCHRHVPTRGMVVVGGGGSCP